MRLEDELKEIICSRMGLAVGPTDIADDQPLFEGPPGSLGLDSIEALELVVGIEEKFGVRIPEDQEVIAQFYSVSSLAKLVRDLIDKGKAQ